MFYDYKTKTKIILSIVFTLLSYCFISCFFGMHALVENMSFKTFISLIPSMWYVKLPLSFIVSALIVLIRPSGSLDNIKSKQTGDGQFGTSEWITADEKKEAYLRVAFGKETVPGFVVGIEGNFWIIDTSDYNLKLLASPGGGKTKCQMIPSIYYNARVNKNTGGNGASMLLTDCKGEELRSTGSMLEESGYNVLYLDFRHPLLSYWFNLMIEVNRYIDKYRDAEKETDKLIYYARAEKFSKMVANSIIDNVNTGMDSSEASAYFKETSQGLITSLILLVSEYGDEDERHIISVFELIIELNGLTEDSSDTLQKNKLAKLLEKVDKQRIKNFAGAAMNADVRTSMNIFSSALGKLLAFIDAELEQMVCRHSNEINAEDFIKKPTAIFIVIPDEDMARHFFGSLFIRYFVTSLISLAEEKYKGVLPRQVLAFWDEFGQMPAVKEVDSIFTAFRSRNGRFLIALQSEAQLTKVYGEKMADIINDACQMQMFTAISPNANKTLQALSQGLGNQTVSSGSITKKASESGWSTETTSSYQLTGKALMFQSDIVTLKKYHWIVRKPGVNPMKSFLPLYFKYLDKADDFEETRETAITKIKSLKIDSIIRKTRVEKSVLKQGMFD